MKINTIVKHPLITEKSTQQAAKGVYLFDVSRDANKHQVAETIERLYEVTVKSVKVIVRKGKEKRVGKKMKTKQMPDRKIAYVTVSKGEIDLFPKA
ncbi:50S ribosomal protein L23 [Candidatus Roizmanbacteria bacterium CG_4_10_14_0_2_um_filter_39_13]|uniref:Large ribosomal subunit protein uL23 n=1 Tax=Candidatus Roizmanbacteria bacterium CG_4_10_14_0_2_um_filter_39_13 TaxID=1974825 RepID=A0A2M7TW72_9BACT|nr:MAG: 50S ribosomal protein L23 [Candidatus Roizmanbacteria bacterium CG_4_10_14_0_2_um_filter_39_13]